MNLNKNSKQMKTGQETKESQEKSQTRKNYSWEFRQMAFKEIEREIENANSIIKERIAANFKKMTAKKYLEFAECLETGAKEVHDCAGLIETSESSKKIERLQSSLFELKGKAEDKSWRCFSNFYAKFIENPEKMERMTVQKEMKACARIISAEMKQVSL